MSQLVVEPSLVDVGLMPGSSTSTMTTTVSTSSSPMSKSPSRKPKLKLKARSPSKLLEVTKSPEKRVEFPPQPHATTTTLGASTNNNTPLNGSISKITSSTLEKKKSPVEAVAPPVPTIQLSLPSLDVDTDTTASNSSSSGEQALGKPKLPLPVPLLAVQSLPVIPRKRTHQMAFPHSDAAPLAPAISDGGVIKHGTAKRRRVIRAAVCSAGDDMECLWINKMTGQQEYRLAEVLAIRPDSRGVRQYYVHYKDYNRRNDEWVDGTRLRKPTGKVLPPSARASALVRTNRRMTRRQKQLMLDSMNLEVNDHSHMDQEQKITEEVYSEVVKVKNIDKIQFGEYLIDAWYYSPFPDTYGLSHVPILYICPHCLKYMKNGEMFKTHQVECTLRHPPGDEIYRYNGVSVFEVDGACAKTYCQNLCLMAKLFFDHKTLYFDVVPFVFYIICEYSKINDCYEMCAYFSKEKHSPEDYNLACILTMPQHQRKGYGRFIIELSYALNRQQGKRGSPEKPLSDLGRIAYLRYWIETVARAINHEHGNEMTVDDIAARTGMIEDDVVLALTEMRMIYKSRNSSHVSIREEALQQYLKEFDEKLEQRPLVFNEKYLVWTPKDYPVPKDDDDEDSKTKKKKRKRKK